LAKRGLTKRLTVDSSNAVEIRSPSRRRSVLDGAAVDADDHPVLLGLFPPGIGGTALDEVRLLAAEVSFLPGNDPIEVTADRRNVGGAPDRQNLLERLRGQVNGNQRAPGGLQVERFRTDALGGDIS
jgi:hypothetical protein